MKYIRNLLLNLFSFSFKILLVVAVLFSQMFLSEIILYKNSPRNAVTNIVQADTSDFWYDVDYKYRKEIMVDHTKVSNTDQANFPVLVSLTQDFLRNTGSGGKIENASGYDILFTQDDGTSLLDFEIEKYVSSTGELKAWVKIPALSASVDTRFYMYYGNSDISSSQENKSGVWDEGGSGNFEGVWHMKDDPSGTAPQISDSTDNSNGITSGGSMLSTGLISGQVDGALSLDGSNDYLYKSDDPSLDFTTQLTLGMWVKSRFEAADVFGVGGKTCVGGGAQDHHYMLLTNGPMLQFIVGDGDCAGAGNNDTLSKTGFFSGYENKWVYISATFDNGEMKLYRNGVLQSSKTSTITSLKSSSANFEIGRYPNYNSFYLLGSVDEVRASSTARSADWIKTEYNNMAWPNDFCSIGSEEMNSPAPLTDWGYRKAIIIDHAKVSGGENLANFPMLVSFTSDSDLSEHAQSDGGDILFTSAGTAWDSGTQGGRLSHEIESYDSATGSLQAWVRMPILSFSQDTVIYMYYGNSSVSNQQDKTAVWDNRAKMVHHMSGSLDNGNLLLDDSTVHSNDGTSVGSMSLDNAVAGKWGNAIYFDGSDDYFVVPSSPSINITTEVTLEAWMKSSDTWNGRSVFGKNYSYALYCLYPNMLRGYIYSGGWKTGTSIGGLYNTSNWYHFVMSYKPSDGVIKVYLNGEEVAYSSQSVFSGSISSNSNPLWIGQAIGGNTFYGRLEEVRLSDTARSAGWIATEYNNGSDPSSFYAVGIEEEVVPEDLSNWKYRKTATVDHTKIEGGSDLENFPLLINISEDEDLAGNARPDGGDIIFTSSSVSWKTGTSNEKLFYEIEEYDSTSGSLQAWVKVPNLSASSDTLIYIYYGNSSFASSEASVFGVWDSNFKMVQHMDESPSASAPQIIDSTVNNHDGTSAGSMTSVDSVEGQISKAIDFDATDDYIDVGGGGTLNSYPLTIKAWVKTDGSGTNRGIVTKYVAASSNGYQLYINNGRIKAWYFNSSSNYTRQDADIDDGGIINDGLWHYVVYRVDASGGSIFVDGVLKNSKAWTGTAKAPTTIQSVHIGKYSFYFNGAIDEVRISDTARSDGWIGTEYNNESDLAFLSLSGEQDYMSHFTLNGSSSQLSGSTQTITINAKDFSGSTNTLYSGDKTITLSGANPEGTNTPTFTDKDGSSIPFGSSGILTFTNGVTQTTLTLYKQEIVNLNITDGTYLSSSSFPISVISQGASFAPPLKPSIESIVITTTEEGYLRLNNLSPDIAHIAVSQTSTFTNSSWEPIQNQEIVLSKHKTYPLYIKLRTGQGAVSDAITFNPQYALLEGDIVKTPHHHDVFIIKYQNGKRYKRLILSPSVFNSYQHLKWENVKTISQDTLNTYITSNLVQVKGDNNIYELTPEGDTGKRRIYGDITKILKQVQSLPSAWSGDDIAWNDNSLQDVLDSIYEVNKVDRDGYAS